MCLEERVAGGGLTDIAICDIVITNGYKSNEAAPGARPRAALAGGLVALAVGAAQWADQGWRAGLRVDAGEGRRMAVVAPATLQDRIEDLEERGWEGLIESGRGAGARAVDVAANRDK